MKKKAASVAVGFAFHYRASFQRESSNGTKANIVLARDPARSTLADDFCDE